MRLHPLHPAAWVLDRIRDAGWHVHDLLVFTRASTLVLASRDDAPPVVLKAGFGSNHVLAELDEDTRRAAYGFYWYAEMTETERALAREDFRHEIAITRTAAGAEHVVPLLEEGTTDRFDWYTMPYCSGGNFRPLLTAGPARNRHEAATGLGILADVAEGLRLLHERQIVHRDVYQENILISDGIGLITDLGAARRIDTPRGPAARGPEVHWPPEYSASYDRATPAADVFSLAVLVYRFLCADIPRHGHSGLGVAPASLRPVISAALAPAPQDRPPIGELRDALRQAATPATALAQRGH
ncbi:protein kinase domain-containing protein [Streptomyces sp. NY05-11A]|uniref:protein kinase domain-containing protein n=1 Tax=Streptomyces soliscabiei TaxID=588897 RepID=UPI0029BF11B2|nr:protein kinase [Streptomyces sp. NY05-11A]MDX2680064.1 protein kinase [Streptomyces sp. NY05-11A]